MATQIVMDHSGDSRYFFDNSGGDALAEAERRFLEFTGKGYTAAVRSSPEEVTRITTFDPTAEETLFFPRLVGG
ncbi:hypothetical protein BST63_35470 [Bradyrhizobium canariense]|jgi:hypothetical protein|uniref:Uncharacterized protein n=1 Tax=Bradyrhizobium canariense TaxID=255045 RepID=A0ABX3WSG9_9BRAD|nr:MULTISPECIES: hypothetical protein [Bradyrhizobium]EHR00217.1 hypothetical protein Bra471DRAFT_00771 [Bradyrhizobium sp. WSM471]OSJ09380.1 hypothetical protein BSR47_31930 [Bradyrhizobium canariense]OSJ21032.1 hypothetical protein BST63_35470 [Bradyrhizobium canariense]UFW42341.1 hypothetical protein BcanWSM471_03795 [Bradyrhizobium canariense]